MTDESERVYLTYEQAIAMLVDGDSIHAFRNTGNVLIGADWGRDDVLSVLRDGKPELAGVNATEFGHGIVAWDKYGPVFFQTKSTEEQTA